MSNSFTWPIDRILLVATTPGQSGVGSDGNEGELCISQGSSINGASPWDCLLSDLRHSLGKSYPSAEMQSVYSTVPTNWAVRRHKTSHEMILIMKSASTQEVVLKSNNNKMKPNKNASNDHKMNTAHTIEWGSYSTGNCARNYNFPILHNGIWTN